MERKKRVTLRTIQRTQKELNRLAASSDNHLQASQVYRKSCQLDRLIVEYMKTNSQMEIIFQEDPIKLAYKK